MDFKPELPTKVWKVLPMGANVPVDGTTISIDYEKFKNVYDSWSTKGYREVGRIGEEDKERKYEHRSFLGSFLFINISEKIVRAESTSESGLAAIASEFKLPMYNR